MNCRWALLADDLTGACDAAAPFARRGFTASVALDERAVDDDADLIAYSTESRNDKEQRAGEKVRQASELLSAAGREIIFKKIDSVLRGPVLAEIHAVREALGGVEAILTPALPEQGRIVRQGRLIVHDPTTGRRVGEPIAVPSEPGVRIADAETPADLLTTASEALDSKSRPLLIGSAGLAEAAAAVLARKLGRAPVERPLPVCSQPVLVLMGTWHRVTRRQTLALRDSGLVKQIALKNLAAAPCDRNLYIQLSWSRKPRLDALKERMRAGAIAAMIVGGGETARFVLEELGAQSIRLEGEFETGVAWGRVRGGDADGIVIVTKSGGFGETDLLIELVRALGGKPPTERE